MLDIAERAEAADQQGRAAELGSGKDWMLSAQPVFVLGDADGDAAESFHGISGVHTLSDGSIVVADRATSELRVFSREGDHLRTLGGRGGGPGEFSLIAAMDVLPGDSMVVVDLGTRRVVLLDENGDEVGVIQMSLPGAAGGGPFVPLGSLSDGSFIMAEYPPSRRLLGLPPGEKRDTLHFVRWSMRTRVADTVGSFPGHQSYVHNGSSHWILFGASSPAAVGRSSFYVGSNETFDIGQYDIAGNPVRRIRRTVPERRVSSADVRAARDEADRRRQRAEVSARAAPTPIRMQMPATPPTLQHRETYPAFDRLLVDRMENLWVRHYLAPADTLQTWSAFDRTGRFQSEVQVPREVEVETIDSTTLLGTVVDSLDIEYVRVYKLIRP